MAEGSDRHGGLPEGCTQRGSPGREERIRHLEAEINMAYDFGDDRTAREAERILKGIAAGPGGTERAVQTAEGGSTMEIRAEGWERAGEQAREGGRGAAGTKGQKGMDGTAATAAPGTEAPEAAPGWVNLTMKGAFLKECTNRQDGSAFFDVRIPEGTKIGGALDVGNWHFTVNANRVHESRFDPHGVQVGLVRDRPLKLTKSVRQEDGSFRQATREVQPENLRVALNEQYKSYKAAKAAERAAARPDKAVAKGAQATPARDRKAAVKSASARAKSGTDAHVRQVSR